MIGVTLVEETPHQTPVRGIPSPIAPTGRGQLTAKRDIDELEEPAQKRQVTGGENESHDAGERGGGSTRLFPLDTSQDGMRCERVLDRVTHAQQTVQQGVVIGQGLAGGGGGVGRDFRVAQVPKFLTGAGGFGFDIIHDGTCFRSHVRLMFSRGFDILDEIVRFNGGNIPFVKTLLES